MNDWTDMKCFILSRMGLNDPAERKRSEELIDKHISPVLKRLKMDVITPFDIKPPYSQTEILRYVMDADLIVANISGAGPNVYFEVAVRQASQRPMVMFVEGQSKPSFYLEKEDYLFLLEGKHEEFYDNLEQAANKALNGIRKTNLIYGSLLLQNLEEAKSSNGWDEVERNILAIKMEEADRIAKNPYVFGGPGRKIKIYFRKNCSERSMYKSLFSILSVLRITLPQLLFDKDNPDLVTLQCTCEEDDERIGKVFSNFKIKVNHIEETEDHGSALIISKDNCSEVFIINKQGQSFLSNEKGTFDIKTGKRFEETKPPVGGGIYVTSERKNKK